MTQHTTTHTTDQTILSNISHLVEEERKLYAKGDFTDAERDRLKKIGVELDQCWDLLRQRRGLREFGRDADQAEVRSPKVVENYKG